MVPSAQRDSGQPSKPTPGDELTVTDGGWLETTGDAGSPTRERGSRVGPYLVLDQLGSGGMGVVYAAHDAKLDRKVALKVLRHELTDEGDAVAKARLIAEGRALARVAHPNVVGVFDVGEDDSGGDVYVAMEFVDGVTLGRWREQTQPTWTHTLSMFIDIAAGLKAVHDAGLVHRDVKPDNILVDVNGRARVTDFGLARAEPPMPPAAAEESPALDLPKEDMRLTRTGARLGTPAYMSSEQLQGQPATERSDQFAFCVAMWECLYGERPFGGEGWVSLILSVSEGQVREPPKGAPGGRPVPPWLRALVERGLCPDAEGRWPSMDALRVALVRGDPHRGRRRLLAVAGVLGAGAAGAFGLQMQADAREEAALVQCEHLAHAVDDVWDASNRSAVEEAFRASNIDNASQIATSVADLTDTFAAQWTAQRLETCVAQLEVQSPQAQRREDCLHRRLGTLKVMVRRFEEPTDAVVSRAQRTAEGLTDLATCADDRQLALRAPMPEEPQRREQAVALAAALSATGVHEHLGDYKEGLRRARASLVDAVALDDAPLLATAHYRVAVFEEKLGNYQVATDAWTTAYRLSVLSGHESLAVDASSALAFTEGYQLSRHEVGIHWATLAGVHLERLGKEASLDEARRLDVLAVLFEMQGDFERSIETHHASLALRRSLVPATHQSMGYGLANLAGVLQANGDLVGAVDALVEAQSIFENAFGPENPTTAHVLKNLANVHVERRDYAKAAPLYDRVERVWIDKLGASHPDIANLYNAQADMLRAEGRLAEAHAKYELGLKIHRASDSGPHDEARTAARLGEVLLLQGHPEQAASRFRDAEALLRKSDDHHTTKGQAHYGLATAARAQGRTEQARTSFERARAAFGRADTPSSHGLARCAIGLASVGHPPAERPLDKIATDTDLGPGVRSEALAWQARLNSGGGDPTAPPAGLAELLAESTPETQLRVADILGAHASAGPSAAL